MLLAAGLRYFTAGGSMNNDGGGADTNDSCFKKNSPAVRMKCDAFATNLACSSSALWVRGSRGQKLHSNGSVNKGTQRHNIQKMAFPESNVNLLLILFRTVIPWNNVLDIREQGCRAEKELGQKFHQAPTQTKIIL